MKKRKIGFIQEAETVGEKQADKLGKKPDVVVKWIIEEKVTKEEDKNIIETDEETKEEIEAVDSKEIETTNSKEVEKEELNNYLNLSILFQLVNHHGVTIANAMRFAVDKEFCDRFLANKSKTHNISVYNELKDNRLKQLEDTFKTVKSRVSKRIKKVRVNNNDGLSVIDLILHEERIGIIDTKEIDIKYIKRGIKVLEDTLKEIKEIAAMDKHIYYNEATMVAIIERFKFVLRDL